jgi:parallel beta-helix repeat protein
MSNTAKVSVSKRKLLLAFVSIALVCSLASGSIMFVVAQGGSTPITISSGIYPGAPTHTIWIDSGTYYSKDAYGVVTSSTNAATVINSAITSGGSINLGIGTFILTSPIISNSVNNIFISGQGKGTILQTAPSTSINTFTISNVYGWTIQNLQIDGNNANNVDGGDYQNQNGLFIYNGANNIIVQNCYIHNTCQNGILIRNTTTSNIQITGNTISFTSASGIKSTLSNSVQITNNYLANCSTGYPNHSIYTYGSSVIIEGNSIYGGGGDGIEAYPGTETIISGNTISYPGRYGIYTQQNILANDYVIVSNNKVYSALSYGFIIVTSHASITGNTAFYCSIGFYLSADSPGTSTGLTLVGNTAGYNIGIGYDIYNFIDISASGNTALHNGNAGFLFDHVSNSSVSALTSIDNVDVGIGFSNCDFNTVSTCVSIGGTYGWYDLYTAGYNTYTGISASGASVLNMRIDDTNNTSTNRIIACRNGTTYISQFGFG